MDAGPVLPHRGRMESTAQALEPLPLMRFVQALHGCQTLDQLGRTFTAGFGRLMAVPMFGFNVVDPGTTRLRHQVAANVSDVFVTRYIREVWTTTPCESMPTNPGASSTTSI